LQQISAIEPEKMKKYPSYSQKLAITMGAICEYIFSDQTKLVIKEKIDELEGLEEKDFKFSFIH
jgi:hypothetical protein